MAFVTIHASVVGAACWALGRLLPPLRNEPAELVLIPMVSITAVMAAILYCVVRRLRASLARALALYLAFVASLVVFGIHLSLYEGRGSPEQWALLHQDFWDHVSLVPVALLFGHFFGMPVLLMLGIIDKLMSPVLTPRPS